MVFFQNDKSAKESSCEVLGRQAAAHGRMIVNCTETALIGSKEVY